MILDLLLPKLSGFGVLEQLRQQDRLKDTPVIVYSNLARPEDIQKARELQVTDYYVKSQIAVEDLCLRAQKLLAEKSITDENRNLRLNSLDVSREFKAMNYLSFKDFLKEKEGEMGMIIRAELTGNVADNNAMLLSLQQFLNGATTIGQKRYAVVKTSEEEHEKYISAFNSGIIWEKE
jgi:CheY-like chemotaxis protein